MSSASRALLLLPLLGCGRASPFPGLARLSQSRQHVLVVVESRNDSIGWLYRMQLGNEGFALAGPPIPITVGAAGVGKAREGDKRAPSGVYPLTSVFGYAESAPVGLRMPYLPLRPETECVDDTKSRFYNQVVNPSQVGGKSWTSSEIMRRDLNNHDDLYKLGLLVAYNSPAKPGAGSCIFLHIWRGPERPTVGCTAMPEEGMMSLLGWLDPAAKPVLIQGTRAELEALAKDRRLPYPVPSRHLGYPVTPQSPA